MRGANITGGIAVVLWLGLLLLGRSLAGGVADRMGGSVQLGQVDYYLLFPAYVVIGLLACAVACNVFRRGFAVLVIVAGLSLFALLPFLLLYGGGV